MFFCKKKSPWYCFTCTKFSALCKVIFIFLCIFPSLLWNTFLLTTLYHYLLDIWREIWYFYSMIQLVCNILWERFFSIKAAIELVIGSFCRYVSCIYRYLRFDELEHYNDYSIALYFTYHQISKTKNSEILPGHVIILTWISWISFFWASLYCVFRIHREVCVIHI